MAERIVNIKLRADATGLIQSLGRARDAVTETGQRLEKSFMSQREQWATVGQGLTGVGVAITGIGVAALKTGIDYNTLQQKSRAALTTIMGSAEAANAQMDKLDEFARNSPFAKQVFIEAQQQLLGFGMAAERVVPTLDAIQNAVAATGGSNQDIAELTRIIAQLEGGVKLSAETFNQFGARGVDAAGIIGEAMGKTGAQIRSEVTAGTLDADAAIQALVDGMQARFGGAAANVKETFAGAMDRVKAAWRDFSAELATPLVDPNGGGALIDLLNWTADMMRAFQNLPGPVKTTVSTLTGLVGVTALVGGTALLALPKIIDFKNALKDLNITGARAETAIAGIAPAMIAIAAAQIGAGVAERIDDFRKVKLNVDELNRSLKETGSGIDEMKRALSGGAPLADLWGDSQAINNMKVLNTTVGQLQASFEGSWIGKAQSLATMGLGREIAHTAEAIADLDAEMAAHVASGNTDTANTLYAEFAELAEQAGWSQERITEALPQYTRAQEGAADATASASDAMADASQAADDVAESYVLVSQAAEAAWKEINGLVDSLNYFNGVGQTAEQQNAKLQQSIADVDEHVRLATQGVDGYSLSLDASTVEGSANRAMLADLASQSQSTAYAIYEQELTTLGAAQATQNYRDRLEQGRQKLVEVAKQFDLNSAEVQALTDLIYQIPTEHEFEILANTAQATQQVQSFIDRQSGRTVWVNVKTTMDQSASYGPGVGGLAYGGTVGYASGGTIPGAANGMTIGLGGGVNRGTVFGAGTAKSDSVLVRLSKGEEVIQQPYAGMNRELLKSINRGDFHQGMIQPQVVVQGPSASSSSFPRSVVLSVGGREFEAYLYEKVGDSLSPLSAGESLSRRGVRF